MNELQRRKIIESYFKNGKNVKLQKLSISEQNKNSIVMVVLPMTLNVLFIEIIDI